jgi:hypothetical protein
MMAISISVFFVVSFEVALFPVVIIVQSIVWLVSSALVALAIPYSWTQNFTLQRRLYLYIGISLLIVILLFNRQITRPRLVIHRYFESWSMVTYVNSYSYFIDQWKLSATTSCEESKRVLKLRNLNECVVSVKTSNNSYTMYTFQTDSIDCSRLKRYGQIKDFKCDDDCSEHAAKYCPPVELPDNAEICYIDSITDPKSKIHVCTNTRFEKLNISGYELEKHSN